MNKEQESETPEVLVRDAKVLVWGPIYVTLNLEKTPNTPVEEISNEIPMETQIKNPIQTTPPVKGVDDEIIENTENNHKKKTQVNILSPVSNLTQSPNPKPNTENIKKVTYIYNLIDHGLDCECIDVKGELLIRSALPVYRKISQGIEFEQITTNQIKLIITSRVLENYQEVFQGFALPKATFRIWILGYKFF